MPPETTVADSPLLVRARIALAGVALLLLFTLVPLSLEGDGHGRWQALSESFASGQIREVRYSYLGPLFASPFLLFDNRTLETWWAMRFNILVLAAGAAASWWMLRGVLSPAARSAFVVLLVVGGMMPFHVRDFYGEVFTAVLVATGLAMVIAAGLRAGWIALVIGAANTPASALPVLLVALWRFARTRRYDGLVAVACITALVIAENTVVRGDPFATGYAGDHGHRTVMPFSGRPGFSYPLSLGIPSLLFSFGKGLLFFAPGLLLVLHARRVAPRPVAELLDAWTILVAGLVLVYAQWWSWYGGWYWGPRFLLVAVYPSALALACTLTFPVTGGRALAASALAAWTLWVGVSGVAYGLHGQDICMADNYALEHLCWYAPEFSPLFRPLAIPIGFDRWQRAWTLVAFASAASLILPVALKRSPRHRSS